MSLEDLHSALRDHGGTLGEYLTTAAPEAGDDGAPGAGALAAPALAASGPRAARAPEQYELLMEMILEGSLLHYGHGRVVDVADPDLALLLGDELYALGLSRLAELGDIGAVSELGDLISLVAQGQAMGDQGLVDAVWRAAAVAIGWGPSPSYSAAKAAARRGDSGAVDALTDAADAVLAPS